MELIDQHTKKIMEGCKERAREQGLRFEDETLEYIVTNKDLLELSPKVMIPTLYDYWVHDVDVLKEKGKYELYPHNPYETVINTRPAISFYNDNNPDWLNVMIFYHVLAHIDFFQNNMLFKHTWDEDFTGKALSDKRFIAALRTEKGRHVDYVIEFTRGIDNIVGFHHELSKMNRSPELKSTRKVDFYFDTFLQSVRKVKTQEYMKEIDRYNDNLRKLGGMGDNIFFSEVADRYPEFKALFEKHQSGNRNNGCDLIQYLREKSPVLQKEENTWMKSVMQIVRKTSLFFQPQIRTKILNEGWASYWHEKLFLADDRIAGNEISFARVNAKVTSLPRVGINPYALGMRLFSHIEELADKGRLSYDYQRIRNSDQRKRYDKKTGRGMEYIFNVRENFSDSMFLATFVDQDFVDRNNLFVTGKRLNEQKGVWEYYVKSRNGRDYKNMLLESLYHPPHIVIDHEKTRDGELYLDHKFEGKALESDFIPNTMLGMEYLWGGPVKLETTEREPANPQPTFSHSLTPAPTNPDDPVDKKPRHRRVLYVMENRKLAKTVL